MRAKSRRKLTVSFLSFDLYIQYLSSKISSFNTKQKQLNITVIIVHEISATLESNVLSALILTYVYIALQ